MPFDPALIPPAVERYGRERDRYFKLANRVAEICREDICDQNAIRAQVTFRVKSQKSFQSKLERFQSNPSKNYLDQGDIFSSISDLSGVRIAAYRHEDCAKIVEHIRTTFRGADGEIVVDDKDRHQDDRANFYRATHAQVYLPEDELVGTYDNVADISCEIQVCTMIAHVWNEIEHDIGYKPELGAPSADECSLLEMLGHTVRQGDQQISMLLAAHAARTSPVTRAAPAADDAQGIKFRDVHDFVSRMQDFGDGAMKKFSDNSGQLFELLRLLELNTPQSLKNALQGFNPGELRDTAAEFGGYLIDEELPNLAPDADSSDLILLYLLEHRLESVIDAFKDKVGRGRGRPNRLYRMARQYEGWIEEEE